MAQDNTSDNHISYFVLEGILNHFALIIKRMVTVIIVILILWTLTIAGFLWYVSLPVEDYNKVTVENDDGNANYIGNDMNGDFNYGESN
jgi:hypothetical protein